MYIVPTARDIMVYTMYHVSSRSHCKGKLEYEEERQKEVGCSCRQMQVQGEGVEEVEYNTGNHRGQHLERS